MTTKASARARQFWKRMSSWYGATRFAEAYGVEPSEDWCYVIDHASREALERALADIRANHPIYPPTFPEFDAALVRSSRPQQVGPSNADRLSAWTLKHRTMSFQQLQGWTFVYRGEECVALDVAADGDAPAFRVRIEDTYADA